MTVSKENKISPYALLNRWLYDGSVETKIPKEVIEANEIGSQYIIWYFKNSIYNIYINKHFNNFDVYQLDKETSLTFLKKTILSCGFKPQFMPKQKTTTSKIAKILKSKYPFYKKDDINLLVSLIDVSEEKDQIYETLGLFAPKKKKTTKTMQKEISKFMLEYKEPEEKDSVELHIQDLEQSKKMTTFENFISGFTIERN